MCPAGRPFASPWTVPSVDSPCREHPVTRWLLKLRAHFARFTKPGWIHHHGACRKSQGPLQGSPGGFASFHTPSRGALSGDTAYFHCDLLVCHAQARV